MFANLRIYSFNFLFYLSVTSTDYLWTLIFSYKFLLIISNSYILSYSISILLIIFFCSLSLHDLLDSPPLLLYSCPKFNEFWIIIFSTYL